MEESKKQKVKMLDGIDVKDIRTRLQGKGLGTYGNTMTPEGLGDTEIMEATGRATCRICGQKILKGEWVIKGVTAWYDNSWTASFVQIHYNKCKEATK